MAELKLLDPKTIGTNRYNPRKTFDDVAIGELAQSIKELGLLQPPTVYHNGGSYVVLCGERRVMACVKLELTEIPCNVVEAPADEHQALQLALVENLQREDLSIAEEAPAIVSLVEGGMKRSAIAKALGKSTGYVGTRYALAHHPEVLAAYIGLVGDMEAWALVGGIESLEIRARIIRSSKIAPPDKGSLNTVRALEKHLGTDLEERQLSQFVQEYSNPKNKIERCVGEGYGCDKERCKHFQELGSTVAGWLGLKTANTWSFVYLCSAEDKVCLTYKKDREKAALKKVEAVDPGRLLDRERMYLKGEWEVFDMESDWGKDCAECKNRYEIPDALHRVTKGLVFPYVYCTANDGACFETKKKAFDQATQESEEERASKRTWITREEAEQKTDEELHEVVNKSINDYPAEHLESADDQAVAVLVERGSIPTVTAAVTWSKFEPPEECDNEECFFVKFYGYSCPESCPHSEDGEPRAEAPKEGAAA